MNMQHQGQQQMPIDISLQLQISKVNARLKAAKSAQERELVFSDLKKTPHLFHAWLRVHGNGNNPIPSMMAQQPMQGRPLMQMGGGNFAAGPDGSQPRGPGDQFAPMNLAMQQYLQQRQQGWPQQRQQPGDPGNPGMGQNQQFRSMQEMYQMMSLQQQGQQPQLPIDNNALQPQILKINARLKAAKSAQEREMVFSDLKKTPHLFHAWLRIHGNNVPPPNMMAGQPMQNFPQMGMGSRFATGNPAIPPNL